MVTATEPGGSLRVIFREPPFSSASATNWLLTAYLLRPADPDLPAEAAGLVGQPPQALELGRIGGARQEAQGMDDDAGLLGGLDDLVVLVGGVVGLAVAQDDQGLAVGPLLGELGDGIEARLVELRGQRRRP